MRGQVLFGIGTASLVVLLLTISGIGLLSAAASPAAVVLFHRNPIEAGEKCAGDGSILRLDLTPQDRLILATFHPSANEPTAAVFAATSDPGLQLIDDAANFTKSPWALSGGAVNFAVNTTGIANDVLGGGVSVPADTFGEGAVSMSALGVNNCSGGTFFVTVIIRSSGSGGRTAKDFIAGAYTFQSIAVTANLTPSCDPTFGFGYSAQATDSQNNSLPDSDVTYDWKCSGGVDPQGRTGNQPAPAGTYDCTVTATLNSNNSCQATSSQQTAEVLAPIQASIAPDATGLTCPAVDTREQTSHIRQPSAWIHIVAVYEAGDMNTDPPAGVHIYKNGVRRLGPPSQGTLYRTYHIVPTNGTLPVRLGTRDAAQSGSASVSYLAGGLDEAVIYPRVLSADEILENYTTATSTT